MTERLILGLIVIAGALPAAAQQEIDAVAEGKKVFETYGCIVCHATAKGDGSARTGPNLYGLFLNEPRDREVADPKTGARRKVKADKHYYTNSVRKSWDALAVAESGKTKGEPFPQIMAKYSKEVISDQAVEYAWHYLRTLADEGQAGPPVVKLKQEKKEVPKTLLEIANEVVVAKRARIFRAPVRGSSGRALHVGLPNGMNYTFDPRTLSVRNVWAGGFLNLSKERSGRGQPGSVRGQGHAVFLQGKGILQPLQPSGEPVDFEFKEPDVGDHKAIERWLWEDRDFPELQSSTDAEFLGFNLMKTVPRSVPEGEPFFNFRVGRNQITQAVRLSDDGRIEIAISGTFKGPQKFKVAAEGLSDIKVENGTLADGVWTLNIDDKGRAEFGHVFSARLSGGLVARLPAGGEENWAGQKLATNTDKIGREHMEVPDGYRSENWESPKDLYGRAQLFEPTGMAVAKDGTIVVATRTAGIWRLRAGSWSLFAEGTYECLGVWIEDDKGDQIVVMQKPEMTRLTDSDGDGRAEKFETVCDDYGFHANYHEYAHGPVRDAAGNYYFTLNLSHGGNERTSWRAGGPFMGSMGGYRGWACRITPEGKFEPYANGLRSPAGLGIDPDGRLWYAENQGEYVGMSKVVPLEKGRFYGHLSGLVSLPGKMKPDSPELKFDLWKDKIRKGAVWLPHGMVANSPGHMTWDQTGGKFGAYRGQMFLGDQTMSNLFRVVPEKVNGVDQGAVIPFARFFASGVMRPVFLPDGSLLIGQTGRGWGAWGGKEASLQRIIYDGETIPADIHHANAATNGFVLNFTRPIADGVSAEELAKRFKVQSWFYTNTGRYGSDKHEQRDDAIERVEIGADKKSVTVVLKEFGKGDKEWIDRLYHIQISDAKQLFGDAPVKSGLRCYFTLRVIPTQAQAAIEQDAEQPHPSTSAEVRLASWWFTRHAEKIAEIEKANDPKVDKKIELLMVGDSITNSFDKGGPGEKVWEKHFAPLNALNLGFGGDRTNHVLWRLDYLPELKEAPKAASLMIGTNNICWGSDKPKQAADGVQAIAKKLNSMYPEMEILVLGVFPRRPNLDHPHRKQILELNSYLPDLLKGIPKVTFMDIGKEFLDEKGFLSKEMMPDTTHPSEKGHEIWAEAIVPTLVKMMGK